MPELPEVESIRRELSPRIRGRTITGVEILWPGAVRAPSPEELCRVLPGRRIASVRRRGKYLLMDLSGGPVLVLHLKMTGSLLLQPARTVPTGPVSAIFCLDDEAELHFVDRRRLGSIWLVEDDSKAAAALGAEPLEAGFTLEVLQGIVRGHRLPIKALLLDQHLIAGLGNMWADEALFEARIHPLRRAADLTGEEVERLHRAIREVLERGLRSGGASVDTYRLPDGSQGNAHVEFRVAHRRGERCLDCGHPLAYTKVRGRGTHFCPICQEGPPA